MWRTTQYSLPKQHTSWKGYLVVAEPNVVVQNWKCKDMIKEWFRLSVVLWCAENLQEMKFGLIKFLNQNHQSTLSFKITVTDLHDVYIRWFPRPVTWVRSSLRSWRWGCWSNSPEKDRIARAPFKWLPVSLSSSIVCTATNHYFLITLQSC